MHLPNEFGGVVFDTASVGVMHALAVAREEAALLATPNAWPRRVGAQTRAGRFGRTGLSNLHIRTSA